MQIALNSNGFWLFQLQPPQQVRWKDLQALTQQPHFPTLQAQQPHPQSQKPQVRSIIHTFCVIVFNSITAACGIQTCPEAVPTGLSTAGVVGVVVALLVVIVLVYTCGLLTGLLVMWRKLKKNHTPSASGDLATPTYEQVLPPAQTTITLKENTAYGHLNS